MKDEFQLDLQTLIEKRYSKIFEPIKIKVSKDLITLYDILSYPQSSLSLLNKYRELEIMLAELSKKLSAPSDYLNSPRKLMRYLITKGRLSESDYKKFNKLSKTRNAYAYSDRVVEPSELDTASRLVSELLDKIKKM